MDERYEGGDVELSVEGACARICLNRPRIGNALSPSMVRMLDQAIEAAHVAGVRLIVLQGAGRHFCTGFDLSDLETCSDGDLLLRFVHIEQVLQKVYSSPVMTVAVGAGRVYGAGADLFAACDRRISLPDASFAFPGSGFGLVLGTRRLATRVGNGAARRLLMEGKDLSVDGATEIGLVTDRCNASDVAEFLSNLSAAASRHEPDTVAALHAQTISRDDDNDMTALVRSASRPGLKKRIESYRRKVVLARSRK